MQDASPLENHHISAAYMLALADEKLSFAAPMSKQDESRLRASCIEMVLSTDMKKHFSVVSCFQVRNGLPQMMIQKGFIKWRTSRGFCLVAEVQNWAESDIC